MSYRASTKKKGKGKKKFVSVGDYITKKLQKKKRKDGNYFYNVNTW